MWITLLVVFLTTWLLYKLCFGRGNRHEPPGPWGLPIVGYLPFFDREKPSNMQFCELAKKYGNVFQLREGSEKMVIVNGHKAIKKVYEKPGDAPDWFTNRMKSKTLDFFLFTPYSAKFWVHKKLLFKAMHQFTTENAVEIETAIHKIVLMFINEAKRNNRQPFDPISLCERFASVLAIYQTYGQLLDSLTHAELEEAFKLKDATQVGEKKIVKCDILPWLKWLPTMWGPISECRKAYEEYGDWLHKKARIAVDAYPGKKNRNCLIDYLCYEASQLEKDDKEMLGDAKSVIVKMSCNTSLYGAFAPLSIAMKWIVFLMALYPEVQEKVRKEIHEKIGKTRRPSGRDEKLLPYTTATYKEMFRYASMAPITMKCFSVETEVDGYVIPKNTPIIANLYSANRDNTVFANADTFDPNRFLTPAGTIDEKAMEQVIEVGLGPRRCGGTELRWFELFTYFTSLVSSCRFEQSPDHPLDPTKYVFDVGAVLKPFKVIMYEV